MQHTGGRTSGGAIIEYLPASGRSWRGRSLRCKPGRRQQSGQVLPVMLFSFVVTLAMLTAVFNASQLTFQRTDLVNAADASAYSGGLQAARSLNFMAYTNRAMVANTIAVGYLVSFISYSRYLADFYSQVTNPREFVAKVLENNVKSAAASWKNLSPKLGDAYDQSQGGHNSNRPPSSDSRYGGTSDSNGFHGVGESFRLMTRGGAKGIAKAIGRVVSTLGYATIGPTDVLNAFYSATQFATYGATREVIDGTMKQVAQSYDPQIKLHSSSSGDFYKWIFPMRPGLDQPPGLNRIANKLGKYNEQYVKVSPFGVLDDVPGVKQVMKAAGAPIRLLTNALGWTKAHVEADPNDFNMGLMKHFIDWSRTTHDSWWIRYNRGWRLCVPTLLCMAPIFPSQMAIDKFGRTDIVIGARKEKAPKKPAPGNNSNPNDSGGGQGDGNQSPPGAGPQARIDSSAPVPERFKPNAAAPVSPRAAHAASTASLRPAAYARGASSSCARNAPHDSNGIGGTGVWIVSTAGCDAGRKIGVPAAGAIAVAARLSNYSDPSADGLQNYQGNAETAAAQQGYGAGHNPSIADQARQLNKRGRGIRRNAFPGSYRARQQALKSRQAAAGGGKALWKKVLKGVESASSGAFKFDKIVNKYGILPRNGSLTTGANWIGEDVLSNGLFDNLPTVFWKFLISIFAHGSKQGVSSLRYHLESLAKGEASAKEFYTAYQGVPFYFMLSEIPFSNVHPDMKLDVTLTRKVGSGQFRSLLGIHQAPGQTLTARAASKLYYYRQPDDDENSYFQSVKAGFTNPIISFLQSSPGFKRLENWYGSTAAYTAYRGDPGVAEKILDAPSDYAEFDNVFNPFWEVRLAKR